MAKSSPCRLNEVSGYFGDGHMSTKCRQPLWILGGFFDLIIVSTHSLKKYWVHSHKKINSANNLNELRSRLYPSYPAMPSNEIISWPVLWVQTCEIEQMTQLYPDFWSLRNYNILGKFSLKKKKKSWLKFTEIYIVICYDLNVYVLPLLPKFIRWNPNPQGDNSGSSLLLEVNR